MKNIVFDNSKTNGITVRTISPNILREYKRFHGWVEGDPLPTEDQLEDWVISHSVRPELSSPVKMEPANIPNDNTFREAWVKGSGKVDVDMPKARDIVRDKVRVARQPELEKLDAAYLRADEQGDTQRKQEIAAEKQVLRDATTDPAIDNAKSPEALKAVRPGGLDWTVV